MPIVEVFNLESRLALDFYGVHTLCLATVARPVHLSKFAIVESHRGV
jgi:hypothetical protein